MKHSLAAGIVVACAAAVACGGLATACGGGDGLSDARSLDEKFRIAVERDFTLHWLGKDEPNLQLHLADVYEVSGEDSNLVIWYAAVATAGEGGIAIYQGREPWRAHVDGAAFFDGVESVPGDDTTPVSERTISIGENEAELKISELDGMSLFHSVMWRAGDTWIEVASVGLWVDDEIERNPFNNEDAVVAVARALVPAE